eukprot:Lithocolla_globosa_v1_NODE_856_length_3177_cov_20.386611.p1 type:complete len:999 gc:universal NODE_856_length_3177_cov_20.386611:3080-84(-)
MSDKPEKLESIALSGSGGGDFEISVKEFQDLVDPKNPQALKNLGGFAGIAEKLHVDIKKGLDSDSLLMERAEFYGHNVLPKVESKSFLRLCWEGLGDKTLLILIAAAVISIAIGVYEAVAIEHEEDELGSWIEGVAILAAVVVVVLAGSINDYQKEKQFRKLNAVKDDHEIKVLRSGTQMQVSVVDIVVGEIVYVDTGDILCADGVFLEGHNIKCDESGMTGESDAIKKGLSDDPFLLSGTKVLEGFGQMMVIAVGENSFNGKTMMGLRTESEETPLQVKLGDLAENIGKLGLAAAIVMLVILLIKYFVYFPINDLPYPSRAEVFGSVVNFFLTAITIVVVAVPEGLPMAVTLALAYATIQMLKDQNLVRVLAACETMGGATTICSDKTGTLTQNKMTVVKGVLGQKRFNKPTEVSHFPTLVDRSVIDSLIEGIAINSTADEASNAQGKITFVGSKTECALLEMIASLGGSYQQIRNNNDIVHMYPFSSARKRMSCMIKTAAGYRLYVKGASEIVLNHCSAYVKSDGSRQPMTESVRQETDEVILKFANDALRTICLAYRDIEASEYDKDKYSSESPESDLVMVGIVGIQDPLRPEVPGAVAQCQHAGIVVRMVTGDNIMTARSIAKQCNILTKGGIVMEGSEFRRLTVDQMDRIVPNLQVLARSSPTDKQLLVERLKANHHTVAVTGDGTNDGPALKLADVGFSMGIAGTEVAKEASDIVLMDDNFASIVRAVVWGRAVFDAVRKFLQFQLTVNITAVSLSFISAVFDERGESALTAVQLLWVNMIMDTMAALALATEPPSENLLNRRPHSKMDALISFKMWRMIIGEAILQLVIGLLLLYLGESLFGEGNPEEDRKLVRTIVFNTFVFLQVWNELNCRKLDETYNVFAGLLNHRSFLIIFFGTVVVQVLVVQTPIQIGFKLVSLNASQWIVCVGLGFLSLPVGLVVRLLPDWRTPSAEPEAEVVTREKLLWENAIHDVRSQIRVVNALRRHRTSYF